MPTLTTLPLGQYTLTGASLGGLYTAFHIPELDSLFDAGIAIRSGAMASRLFLSHAHLDHLGALPSLLGMRGMLGGAHRPLNLFCPQGIEDQLRQVLNHLSVLHAWPLDVEFYPMKAGEELQLTKTLWVRALSTFHPVPSLGYLLFERIGKLRPEYKEKSGIELRDLKRDGVVIHYDIDRPKVAYLTDTLPEALKHAPEALEAEVLILECTFVSDKKGVEIARAGCHIHLDELEHWAPRMNNRAVVLMHFSQVHRPSELRTLLRDRLQPTLGERLHLFLPSGDGEQWWL